MKKIVLAVVFGLFFVAFSNAQESVSKEAVKVATIEKVAAYQCPMDCEKGKTYAKPGSCPVCKMDLKKVDASKNTAKSCSGTPKKGCCASKKAAAAKKSCSKGGEKKSCSKDGAKKASSCSKGAVKKSCSGKKASSCKSGAKKSCSKKKA